MVDRIYLFSISLLIFLRTTAWRNFSFQLGILSDWVKNEKQGCVKNWMFRDGSKEHRKTSEQIRKVLHMFWYFNSDVVKLRKR